jgi:arginase family enzyme
MNQHVSWRRRARQAIRAAWRHGGFLLWLAGNHLAALPIYEELAQPGQNALILQFDAHLDIQQFSDCTTELSHGNFLRHCPAPLPRIINIGHRDLLMLPGDIAEYYHAAIDTPALVSDPEAGLDQVRQAVKRAERVFIDIDCDVFDPAFLPAAAHPLPLGLTPHVLLRFLEVAWSGAVVGLSISEFDPGRDEKDRSLSLLVWLLEHVFLKQYESAVNR